MNYSIPVVLVVVILVIILAVWLLKIENLSLSQFPERNCGLIRYRKCCGSLIQDQNQPDRFGDYGGFAKYKVAVKPACVIRGTPPTGNSVPGALRCETGCYCPQAADTFDSGSTYNNSLKCPVPFPPIELGYYEKRPFELRNLTELGLYNILESGNLVISALDLENVKKVFNQLVLATKECGIMGYADFYYINSSIFVMYKKNGWWYYMFDFPIKYNPENIENYVNKTRDWRVAKTAFHNAANMLRPDSPVVVFEPILKLDCPSVIDSKPEACCPRKRKKRIDDCEIWPFGQPYGSGNWTHRV